MADIFISYAHEDRARIERLSAALEAEGLSVWWDRHIAGGAEFTSECEARLNAAKAVLVAWSKASVASAWVCDEASHGRDRGILAPITIDGVAPRLGFRSFLTIDLSAWRGDRKAVEFQDLVRVLKARVAGAAVPEAGPRKPPNVAARLRRHKVPIIGGVAAALAIAAGFILLRPGIEITRTSESRLAAAREKGVGLAVLPFTNLSSDREQEYFADGLTEELLNWLGNVEGLKVPGRTSSFQYKGKAEDLRAIGEALEVQYVLEGSVRRSGDALRITAQLIDATTGFRLWSGSYDRKFADIFAIQDELARIVVVELLGKIPDSGAANPAAVGAVDPRSHELYLEGRALWAVRDANPALEKLRAAIAVDPGHALAQAYLAVIGAWAIGNGVALPAAGPDVDALVDMALAAAVKARPQSADVLFAQGWVASFRNDKDLGVVTSPVAIDFLERAVRANPRHVEALHALSRRGDLSVEQRIVSLERILAIDPGLAAARNNLTRYYLETGQFEKTRALARQTFTMLPDFPRGQPAYFIKLTGDLALFGEVIFADWEATERDQFARFVRGGLLADLGAVEEARFLFERETAGGEFACEARINAATLTGDVASQLRAAEEQYATGPTLPFAAWELAVPLIAAGEPERAYQTLLKRRPDFATAPDLSAIGQYARQEFVTAAHALSAAGRRDQARLFWKALLANFEARPARSWQEHLLLALVHGRLGDRSAAIVEFNAAYDAGFRYPWSYDCDSCVQGGFYAERGLFAVLLQIPEIAAVIDRIESENARTLEEFNRKYGVLDRVRAMMAAKQ